MGWAIGYIGGRDVGYGVPAVCEHPDCNVEIDRGLAYACGGFPDSEYGCGLFFCDKHMQYAELSEEDGGEVVQCCEPCAYRNEHPDADWHTWPKTYDRKPDVLKWVLWKLNAPSWKRWRTETPQEVTELRERVATVDQAEVTRLMEDMKEDLEEDE